MRTQICTLEIRQRVLRYELDRLMAWDLAQCYHERR